METRAGLILLLVLSFGANCGGGDDGPRDSCSLITSLSGGVQLDVDYNDTDGCGGSYSDTERSRVLAYGGLGQLLVRVIVLDTDEDAVGSFSGRVEIRDEMDQEWATGDGECSVTISENSLVEGGRFEEARLIVGTATCSADAVAASANTEMQPITIGPIEIYSCVLC
jgi:hypothetical protein